MLRELWRMMWLRPSDLLLMTPLRRQIALAKQFNAWMTAAMLLFVPPGLLFLALAFWKAAR